MKYKNPLATCVAALPFLVATAVGQDESTASAGSEPEVSSPCSGGPHPPSSFNDLLTCWKYRALEPGLRVYFDNGRDDPNELDLFNNGAVAPQLSLIEFYRPFLAPNFLADQDSELTYGPSFGFGMTAPAGDSSNGANEASSAPVFIISAGVYAEIAKTETLTFSLETGYAVGFSADERLDDGDDGAFYVGLKINF